MSAFEVKPCSSCQAPVIWTTTHKGRLMPVDAEPVTDGNVRLRQDGERVMAEYLGKEHPGLFDEDDRARYVTHFATCPQAGQWRKP